MVDGAWDLHEAVRPLLAGLVYLMCAAQDAMLTACC